MYMPASLQDRWFGHRVFIDDMVVGMSNAWSWMKSRWEAVRICRDGRHDLAATTVLALLFFR